MVLRSLGSSAKVVETVWTGEVDPLAKHLPVGHDTPMWGSSTGGRSHPQDAGRGPSTRTVNVRRVVRRQITLIMVAAAALLPAACAYRGLGVSNAVALRGEGTLAAPTSSSTADTYNPATAPVGAQLTATLTPAGDSTIAELMVTGMVPNRGYAAHAHVNGCGDDPGPERPHYQDNEDPAATSEAPSTNPEYANPNNEIWLDFRTDATGAATARTTVPFVITDRGPGSIVVHEAEQTATGPGKAGTAGARIACVALSARYQ